MAYVWLILSAACSVAASVALKAAAGSAHPGGAALLGQALPYVSAIGAYGLGFGFYALALRQLDLTLAYPLMVAFAIAGVFVYGLVSGAENVTAMRMAGAVLIAIGVFLILK